MITRIHDELVPLYQASDVVLPTGVRVRYVEQGDPAGPAVILLHGYTDSWFSWSEILPRISPAYHVFAFDQRGHGDSDQPLDGYAVSDFAADVLAFMDAAGLVTATLVGHSMGSFIAQRTASIAPHRVTRLVLAGSSASPVAVVAQLIAVTQTLGDRVPVEFVRGFTSGAFRRPLPEAFIERAVAEGMKAPARVWRAAAAAWLMEERWADPTRLRMPILIVWGDQDAIFSRADQDNLMAALPHARLTVYEGTGHSPQWEQPQRFARDLEAFLRAAHPAPAN